MFDRIDHTILLNILCETIHDNRFIRLMSNLLKAGYLEQWQYNETYSGVPQGSIVGPILTNLVLDRLDKFVEGKLIPAYTSGQRRKTNPPYVALTKAAFISRKAGDNKAAKEYNQTANMTTGGRGVSMVLLDCVFQKKLYASGVLNI